MKQQNKNNNDDTFFKYDGTIIPDEIDRWIRQKEEYINFLSDMDEDFEDLSEIESEQQQFDYYGNIQQKLKKKFLETVIPHESFQFLGITPTENAVLIRDRFNELAIELHPDKGGDRDIFQNLLKHKTKCMLYARRYQDGSESRFQSIPADISDLFSKNKK